MAIAIPGAHPPPPKKSKRVKHRDEAAQLLDKDIFNIDQNRLDDEWLAQPKLFGKYAEELANARYDLELAKAKLDVARAEVDMAIREDPKKFGFEKVTEGGIAAAVLLSKEVKITQQAVIDKKHFAELLQAAVSALDHRKRALENLVTLLGMDYFSKPKARNPAAAAVVAEGSAKGSGKRRNMRDRQ